MITGAARTPRPFVLCADALAPVSDAAARALWALGVTVLGRYLETLTIEEAARHHAIGFSILPLTEGLETELTGDLGQRMGAGYVAKARALGIPQTVHLTLDHEANVSANAMTYLNNAAGQIFSGGYAAELYVGEGQALTARQLFSLRVNRYWRGGSANIPEPECGFCMVQGYPLNQSIAALTGLLPNQPGASEKFDLSFLAQDYRGRSPVLWAPA